MSEELLVYLYRATLESGLMVSVSFLCATMLGLPMGVFLATSEKGELLEAPWLNRGLGVVVNIGRSVPFIILVVAIIPFTRFVVGTSIGTTAAIVPLTVGAVPFIARLIEAAVREVDYGLTEASKAMGATPFQVISKVLLPEAAPGIVLSLTLALVSLLGFSAMVGLVGGGGLGDLAIRYGYQRFLPSVMLMVVVVLVVVVQSLQSTGDYLARRLDKRKPK